MTIYGCHTSDKRETYSSLHIDLHPISRRANINNHRFQPVHQRIKYISDSFTSKKPAISKHLNQKTVGQFFNFHTKLGIPLFQIFTFPFLIEKVLIDKEYGQTKNLSIIFQILLCFSPKEPYKQKHQHFKR